MKKLFSLLILTTVVLAVAFSLASCKKEESNDAPPPVHVHTESNQIRENEIAATCTKGGSYELVTYCTECSEEMSRVKKSTAAAGHKAGDAVVENSHKLTCTTSERHDDVVYCTVCRYEMSRKTVITNEHQGHQRADVVTEVFPATCTKYGHTDKVVYCQNCTYEFSRYEIHDKDALGHLPLNAVVPTEGEFAYVPNSCCGAGYYWELIYCDRCNEVIDKEKTPIPQREHTPSETPVYENYEAATCLAPASHDVVIYCAECGDEEISRTREFDGEKLNHSGTYNVRENYKAFTCEANGYYDDVDYCLDCGLEHRRDRIIVKAHCIEADPVKINVVEPDPASKLDGSYDLAIYCVHCKKEFEDKRITMIVPYDGSDEYIYKGEEQ